MIPFNPKNPLSDFRNFLSVCWKCLGLPKPTRRQLAIAHFMQYGPRRKVVEAFRGVGKSWIASAFVMFVLLHSPDKNIMVVSASKQRADNFTTFCMRLIREVPVLSHLAPGDDQRRSKIAFDVAPAPASQSPSVYSIGITGQIAGNRADLVIPDDVEVPNNSQTQAQREKLSESVKEFDAVLKPGGHVLYLGTPQTEESIYTDLGDRGYTIRIWPARYPDEKQRANYGERLAPDILTDLEANPKLVGKSTEAERFTDMDLLEREVSYGRAGFALQFMLDTNLSDLDRFPLKLSDMLVAPLNEDAGPERAIWSGLPEYGIEDLAKYNVGFRSDRFYRPIPLPNLNYQPYQGVVMSIDPSGRGKDETAYAVVASLNGMLFLLDAGGLNGYGDEVLRKLADTARRWKTNRIVVEANFGDGMFTKLLSPVIANIYPCTIEEVKHSTQKEKRIIDTLEPVMASHKLIVNQALVQKDFESVLHYPTDVAYQYRLFYQLSHITRDRGSLPSDDRVDALAIAVNYFTSHVAQDIEKAIQKQKARKWEAELKKFMANALGKKMQRRSYMSR